MYFSKMKSYFRILSLSVFLMGTVVSAEEFMTVSVDFADADGMSQYGTILHYENTNSTSFIWWLSAYMNALEDKSIEQRVQDIPLERDSSNYQKAGISFFRGETFLGVEYARYTEDVESGNKVLFFVEQPFFVNLSMLKVAWEYLASDIESTNDSRKQDKYLLNFRQVLTDRWVAYVGYEHYSVFGFLSHPLSQIRYRNSFIARGYSFESSVLPTTRVGKAFQLGTNYYLANQNLLLGMNISEYRDNWSIYIVTTELHMEYNLSPDKRFDLYVEHVNQKKSKFYSDLFDYSNFQSLATRDRSLSSFTGIHFGGSLLLKNKCPSFIQNTCSTTLFFEYAQKNYSDYRDLETTLPPEEEPFYRYSGFQLGASFQFTLN